MKKNKQPSGPNRSRREFLIAGGIMMATLSLDDPRPKRVHRKELRSHTKIREIMDRYGSEIGDAPLVS